VASENQKTRDGELGLGGPVARAGLGRRRIPKRGTGVEVRFPSFCREGTGRAEVVAVAADTFPLLDGVPKTAA
jgi:hypothetical protein